MGSPNAERVLLFIAERERGRLDELLAEQGKSASGLVAGSRSIG